MTDSHDHMGYTEPDDSFLQRDWERSIYERIDREDAARSECDEHGHDWQPRQTDKRCRRCGYVSDYDVNDIPF